MKKITLLCCSIILVVTLCGCATDSNTDDKEKYTLNGSVAYGAVDNNLDQTKVTYDVVISGNKDDIIDMRLFQGIKLIDKNNNEYILKVNKD